MTSATSYHPGLTFATLVVQFVMAQAVSLPSLARRRGGVKKGGGDGGGGDGDPAPAPANPSSNPPPTSSISSPSSSTTHTSSASQSQNHTSSTSSGPSASITSSSTLTSSSSTSPSPTLNPVVSSAIRTKLSTPAIIGTVIGVVIIAGLLCMLLAKCIHRAHKARRRPRGFLPLAAFFAPAPPSAQPPTTEMSQTHSSPLISSAVAAGATSSPVFTRYSRSFSTSGTSSLSPPMPAASLQHSHSIGSSSNQSTTHTRATADLEILQTPPGSPLSGLLPIISAGANGSASTSRAMEPESSPLHRAMTSHQKALEADSKGHDDVATMEVDKIEGVNDPPPGYND